MNYLGQHWKVKSESDTERVWMKVDAIGQEIGTKSDYEGDGSDVYRYELLTLPSIDPADLIDPIATGPVHLRTFNRLTVPVSLVCGAIGGILSSHLFH